MTYIIAEVGSNFSTFQDCSQSITTAKHCGADAVKFQYFTQEKLYGYSHQTAPLPGELPFEWIPALSEKAKAVGIDFIISVFDLDDIVLLAPYVDAFKIASCEFMYFDLYAAIKETGKKIIASCGAHTYYEVETVLKIEDGRYAPDTLMYCCVEYPSTHHDLRHIEKLSVLAPGTTIGYSDHSTDVFAAPCAAVRYGATVIEKHFRLDHIVGTADYGHSLNPMDFQLMVKAIRGLTLDMHAFQNDAVLKYKRRIKAIAPIVVGEPLEFHVNIGFVRSKENDTQGASYLALPKLNGQRAKRVYRPGDPINPVDYQ
jgi:sialic acid synthase SpsE